MLRSALVSLALGVLAVPLLQPIAAEAGCGCDKAPPPPAAVRPAFGSPGNVVTFFGEDIEPGKTYEVRFDPEDGESREVDAVAVRRRDLADRVMKPQIRATVPSLPPGPARIKVTRKGGKNPKIEVADFTVLQKPLALDQKNGETVASCYRAAVGSDGTMYIPLDVSAVEKRMIFNGLGEGYPLLFNASDVMIYNTQGFLMQLLLEEAPGFFDIHDAGAPNSFELTYDRHEFQTYRQQHVHMGGLALDPSDPAWHVDGSPHVDHDNLVIAIQGRVENEGAPDAGSTPPFDLSVVTALGDESGAAMDTHTVTWSTECGRNGKDRDRRGGRHDDDDDDDDDDRDHRHGKDRGNDGWRDLDNWWSHWDRD